MRIILKNNKKITAYATVFVLLAVMQTTSCKKHPTGPEYNIMGTWIITKYEEGRGPVTSQIRFVGDENEGRVDDYYYYTVDVMNVEWSYFTHGCLSSYEGQFITPFIMEGTWLFSCAQVDIDREGYWRAEKIESE
jgi:hypothetical protein